MNWCDSVFTCLHIIKISVLIFYDRDKICVKSVNNGFFTKDLPNKFFGTNHVKSAIITLISFQKLFYIFSGIILKRILLAKKLWELQRPLFFYQYVAKLLLMFEVRNKFSKMRLFLTTPIKNIFNMCAAVRNFPTTVQFFFSRFRQWE